MIGRFKLVVITLFEGKDKVREEGYLKCVLSFAV